MILNEKSIVIAQQQDDNSIYNYSTMCSFSPYGYVKYTSIRHNEAGLFSASKKENQIIVLLNNFPI